MRLTFALLALAGLAAVAAAEPQTQSQPQSQPAARSQPAQREAQRETVSATLNGKKVSIDYGRPALGGRSIDTLLGQLPADRIWRAGMNQVTTLTTETDLVIGDKRVPAGKYSVYVHAPASGDWALVLNKDPGVPLKVIFPAAPPELADALWPRLDGYAKIADKEVARIPLKSVKPTEPVERFMITMEPAREGASALTLSWGDRAWTIGVRPAA